MFCVHIAFNLFCYLRMWLIYQNDDLACIYANNYWVLGRGENERVKFFSDYNTREAWFPTEHTEIYLFLFSNIPSNKGSRKCEHVSAIDSPYRHIIATQEAISAIMFVHLLDFWTHDNKPSGADNYCAVQSCVSEVWTRSARFLTGNNTHLDSVLCVLFFV